MTQRFSDAWARALGAELNVSDEYRRAAERWEGAILLEWLPAAGLPAERGVFLDLWHGRCHAASSGSAEDYPRAAYVLAGDSATWEALLDGRMAPIAALLRGKLKLVKGSLAGLLPHVSAASELVAAAGRVDGRIAAEGRVDTREEADAPPHQVKAADHPATPPDTADGRGDRSAAVDGRVDLHSSEAQTPSAAAEAPSSAAHPPPNASTRHFQSIGPQALRYDSPPMRLWEKAKRLGVWNPADIDFSLDRLHWLHLPEVERDFLLRLTAMFEAGEESVTADILPLMMVIADEGRLEEEIYLTSFLWEEAKHVEAFRRFFDQVAESREDLSRYHTPSYRRIFYEELPTAMGRLRTDRSPVAQAHASVTYNLIVEGVLAETGYHVYNEVLRTRGIMPGMQRVSALLKTDESRHLAYGVFLLSRLVVEHGDEVWDAILARMNELVEPAVQIIHEAFACYDAAHPPFGLTAEPYVEYALAQFEKRMSRVELARTQSLSDLYRIDDAAEFTPVILRR